MGRSTIDFGIDLGTTNSAIALLRGASTEVIKNNLDADITPSAVYIDKRDSMHVGVRAKDRIVSFPEDAYVEFKRRMGTAQDYSFKSSGRKMRPEELSAEVLKSLRADVQQRLGEDLTAAVITVPAAFEQRQCAATRKAAELAGFVSSPLVQEPVAAALAYGFQVESERGYWLVFDFGGGTFDAAVLKAEDGSIDVVNHGGNNFLGGSDIDWAIIDQILAPYIAKEYRLNEFSRSNPIWQRAFSVIKRSAELTKIQLSRQDAAYLEDCRFKDEAGDEIEVEYQLSRSNLISVAEPIIQRAVDITRKVLQEKNLAARDIAKVILVGGPTLAPYFVDMVQSNLGVKIDVRVDPLTVVARGAAVFAGTQRLAPGNAPKLSRGTFEVELNYAPVGPDADPTVRGAVKSQDGASVEGFSLELANQQSGWRSGKISLRADGKFKVNLRAERGDRNVFVIELYSPAGAKQQCAPESFDYTIGMAIHEQPIINSIGVATINNRVQEFFKKGNPLPARYTYIFRSAVGLRVGQHADLLRIPVVEGDNPRADRNRRLGELLIRGSEIKRDLQSGREIEVTLDYDESRQLKVKAYVPDLDEEYAMVLLHHEGTTSSAELDAEYDIEMRRLDGLRQKAQSTADPQALQLLEQLDRSGLLREVANDIAAARGDYSAGGKAETQILQLKIQLDQIEDALAWPALVAEAREAVDDLQQLASSHGGDRSKYSRICAECEAAMAEKNVQRLRKRLEEVKDAAAEIVVSQDQFWVGYFQWLEENKHKMSDGARAQRLIDHGRQCIEKNNIAGLRSACGQLRDLLPKEAAADAPVAFRSGLIG